MSLFNGLSGVVAKPKYTSLHSRLGNRTFCLISFDDVGLLAEALAKCVCVACDTKLCIHSPSESIHSAALTESSRTLTYPVCGPSRS